MRETEETQDKLSKKAPELVKRQRELEAIIDDFRERYQQIEKEKGLMILKEKELNYELSEAERVQQMCEKAV